MRLELWAHIGLFLLASFFLLKDAHVLAHELTESVEDAGSLKHIPLHQHQPLRSGSVFILKVLVNELVSGQRLNQASVEVFVNHSRTQTVATGDNGVALLHLPYQPGALPLTIVARKDGYILSQLPWTTSKMPIYSSVTLSLASSIQGNLWLFEDSVLISVKSSGVMLQPSVQFPKNRLNLTNDDIISSLRAFLTVPKLSLGPASYLYTMGLLIIRYGFSSVELTPVAAISVQLFSGEQELQVSGPIHISLPLPTNSGLKASDTLPAWMFDRNTGSWMNRGVGVVKMVEGKMMWTFNASYLGYWIAAPLPSTQGNTGQGISMDTISYHTSLLILVGGILILLIGIISMLFCCNRAAFSNTKVKSIRSTNTAVSTMDQTTSTYDQDLCEVSSDRSTRNSTTHREENGLIDVQCDGNVFDVQSEHSGVSQHFHFNATSELLTSHGSFKLSKVPLSIKDNIYFEDGLVHLFHQPLSIFHAPPGFINLDSPLPTNKSATLPRTGTQHHSHPESVSKDSPAHQPLPKDSLHHQGPASEEPSGVPKETQNPSSSSQTWDHYSSLPESVSIPGMLSNTRSCHPAKPFTSKLQENSEQAVVEQSKLPRRKSLSPRPVRAWFVSLEGKPAAEIHHSVRDTHRRRRPADSRDNSLDSGVDMSEPNQQATRKPLKLERARTFLKRPTQCEPCVSQEASVGSEEVGSVPTVAPKGLTHEKTLDSMADSGTDPQLTDGSGELLETSEPPGSGTNQQ